MKRRDFNLTDAGKLSAGGGGGGWKAPRGILSRSDPSTNRAAAQVQRSIDEAGGYPSRNAKPLMTKMEQRKLERAANRPQPDLAAQAARKAKFKIK